MQNFDVIIIGAGAAGLFCGIEAARRGRKTLVIDHAAKAAGKIRISGGGRCNFTNLDIRPERFLSQNSRFAVSALSRYTQWDFIDRVANAGIAYHEKTLGQLFCDGSAQEIIDMLLDDLRGAGGSLWLETEIKDVSKPNDFNVETSKGKLSAQSVVIACGGKSIPKMGATGLGYEIAQKFEIPIVDTRAALVPLTFGDDMRASLSALSGTSVRAEVGANGVYFEEGMLFTHRGLSGPSILQVSSYWREGDDIVVNLAKGTDVLGHLKMVKQSEGRREVQTALGEILPKSVVKFIMEQGAQRGRLADFTGEEVEKFARRVTEWRIKPSGSEGYRTAEVTLGGIDTQFLSSKTMETRNVKGLYAIGEVVDVTGWLGGYNFQWAWSSGWAAGQYV